MFYPSIKVMLKKNILLALVLIISGYNVRLLAEGIFTKLGISFLFFLAFWTLLDYRIVLFPDKLEFNKLIKHDIYVDYSEIQKIKLDTTVSGYWRWDRMYVYSGNNVFEQSITRYDKKALFKALLNICASNSIELDVKELRFNRYDAIIHKLMEL
jgi:hypothetical protein